MMLNRRAFFEPELWGWHQIPLNITGVNGQ